MTLFDLQHSFKESLWDEEASLFLNSIKTKKNGMSPADRFSIYRNNITSSLAEELEALFPKVTSLIGCEAMRCAAMLYIKKQLPQIDHFNDWGEAFPGFISTIEAFQSLPYLQDIASSEWLNHKALNSEDAQAIEAATFFAEAERLKEAEKDFTITLHPSLFLLQAAYPLEPILKIAAGEGEEEYQLEVQASYYMIFRYKAQVQTMRLKEEDFIFCQALQNKKTFTSAFEQAFLKNHQFDLQKLISTLLSLDLISSIN